MRIMAVVEISSDMGADVQTRLAAHAYRWSRAGLVVIFVRDVCRRFLDRALNPVVAAVGLDVYGILYIDGAEIGRVLTHLSPDTTVFAASDELQSPAHAAGSRVLAPAEALLRPEAPDRPLPQPFFLPAVASAEIRRGGAPAAGERLEPRPASPVAALL